jgi:microcompartment protein CcmL/EutN
MSRLDVLETNKAFVEHNEIVKELIEVNDAFLKAKHIHIIDNEEIGPQDWIEIYLEDQVKVEECSCRCR